MRQEGGAWLASHGHLGSVGSAACHPPTVPRMDSLGSRAWQRPFAGFNALISTLTLHDMLIQAQLSPSKAALR